MDRRQKLTENDIAEIRRSYEAGERTQVELARAFGVTQAHICSIVNNKSRVSMRNAGFIKASEKTDAK